MRLAAAALAGAALLGSTATAQAAQRYASPAGTGEACSQLAPCSLETAVEKAKANDEVIVGGGSYPLAKALPTPEGVSGLDIHGDTGGPMPTVKAASGGKLLVIREGAALSYLEIVDQGNPNPIPLVCIGSVDRVRIVATGTSAVAAEVGGACALRDSLLRAEGDGAEAVFHTGLKRTTVMRNVTAIATGAESTGVASHFQSAEPGSIALDIKNVIARGDANDLQAVGDSFGTTSVTVSNSNFATSKVGIGASVTSTGNQTAPPLFVNAAAGDYREAAGSPTIDAGVADQLGTLDLAGNPRTLGAAPDIGAYEFAPPPPGASAGVLLALALAPTVFRAAKSGGAIVSASARKAKPKGPVGATVTYYLSGTSRVDFNVERLTTGRMMGKRCVKQTPVNKTKKRCGRASLLRGGFSSTGAAGNSLFTFSGRLGGSPLRPGRYRLVGSAGGAVKRASFRIVR